MRFQSAKYQATNSPSKIEGAGGEYDVVDNYFLIVASLLCGHTPPNPLYLRGGTSFRKIN